MLQKRKCDVSHLDTVLHTNCQTQLSAMCVQDAIECCTVIDRSLVW